MGTRGLYGIRKNGIDKATYNHFDSYPDWLGKEISKFCINNSVGDLENFFNNIKLVDEESNPTDEQIEECKAAGYADFSVSNGDENEWYCLLRELQGNFTEYQKCIDNNSNVYMTDGIDFIKDSLWCEYAYIINLDDNVLEFYVGNQTEPQEGNRYGTEVSYDGFDGTKFYPCKLLMTFPLEEMNDAVQVAWAMDAAVEDDCKSNNDD